MFSERKKIKDIFIGQMPSLDGSVRFLYPQHVTLSKQKGFYEDDMSDGMENDDSDDEEECADDNYIYLYHSLKNDRASHMIGNSKCKVMCEIKFLNKQNILIEDYKHQCSCTHQCWNW